MRIAPRLYIRETRHLRGFYELQVSDIHDEERFSDRVALASYPLDLPPYVKGQINPFGPERYYYTLLIRTMGVGQATGVAAALCVKQRLTPHQMRDPRHYTRLQKVLRSTGADIGDRYPAG